ncbi:MAG: response regulator [Chloroflexi bacterium]|nr:response regulator [Chloroflexota bacterium]
MSLIIIIEDDAQSARLAMKILQRDGHHVMLASDGECGLTMAFGHQPDAILVDLGLPDLDGQTVVALMRQQASLAQVPILAFTAWPEAKAREMAHAYGCDGVITKPIDTRSFAAQVNTYLPPKVEP